MLDLISSYTEVRECDFKDRHYSVRDNGAVMRHPKDGSRPSKLDCIWTFGTKDNRTGYMLWGGVRVHQIVATAFHDSPEDQNMVIDHIDTNRCNNRPENLRWVTRLENVLNNPVTRKRITLLLQAHGHTLSDFIENPAILRESATEPNTKWMRTVSKDEAAKCKKNLSRWTEENQPKKPNGAGIDEWVYQNKGDSFGENWDSDWYKREYKSDYQRQIEAIEQENQRIYEEEYGLKDSLTPGAKQLNWKVTSEFPLCPKEHSSTPLQDYLRNLKKGEVFCCNGVYQSLVHKAEISDDGNTLAVITTREHVKGTSGYVLSVITYENGYFVHENHHSYYEEIGAEKYLTIALGRKWTRGDVMDDYC